MKRILSAFAVVALTLVVAASANAETYTRDLTIGSTGSDVVALQDMLVASGDLVMPAGVSKGYFGNLTKSALAKWQAANGVSPAAGYFGPVTMAKVKALGGSTSNDDDSDYDGSSTISDCYDPELNDPLYDSNDIIPHLKYYRNDGDGCKTLLSEESLMFHMKFM
jgi:peptidoglycan hydrolase-like protein with peptidoglycan-binding domain